MNDQSYIEKLEEENKKLQAENQKLQAENQKLSHENRKLAFTVNLNEQTLQRFREMSRMTATNDVNNLIEDTLRINKLNIEEQFGMPGAFLC